MNLIDADLSPSLIVGAKTISTDFRIWVKFTQIFFSGADTDEQIYMICSLLGLTEEEFADHTDEILAFYSPESKQSRNNQRLYDFEEDSSSITAAFRQQYGVSLTSGEYLHWWEFCALLGGLTEDTAFIKRVQYRSVDLTKIKDPEQYRYYAKLKEENALHDKVSNALLEEINDEFYNT